MRKPLSGTGNLVQHTASSTRATPVFLGLLFVLLLSVQLFLYRDSFAVKPSNDDFIALHQVDRGEREGVSWFFKASDSADYRPLQNVTFWLFGRLSKRHTLLSLRILHFLSFAFYALVAFLWIRALNLNRVGAIAAACIVFFHPILAGPLGGLDNYTRFVASAWVWLGAWVAYRWSRQPMLAVPLVSLCLAIGLGYMEYTIALIPLAVLTTAARVETRRLDSISLMFASLVAIFSAYFLIRVSGMVVTTPGTEYISLSPLIWVENSAMILAAVLFFGNTVPIMLEWSLPRLAWLGWNVTLVALVLGYGLWAAHRSCVPLVTGDPRTVSPTARNEPVSSRFLIAAFVATLFPMLLMKHISEIYLTAVTLAVALLTGVSADGWTTVSRPLRYVALFVATCQLLLASNAIQGKVAGINEAGERTDAMVQQLLKHIQNDKETKRVAIVFLKQNVARSKGYSIFAMRDDQFILHGFGTFAMRWIRPDQDIVLDHLVVGDPCDVDLESYDQVLLWEGATKQFNPIARAKSRV